MGSMIGANVGDLRSLAQSCERDATQLEAVATALRGTSRAVWLGSDAQSFYGQADSDLIPQLNRVAEALRTAGEVLRRNAAEQEATSDTLDGSGGSSIAGHGAPSPVAQAIPGLGETPTLDQMRDLLDAGLDITGWLTDIGHLLDAAKTGLHLPQTPFGGIFGKFGQLMTAYDLSQSLMKGEFTSSVVDAWKLGTSVMTSHPAPTLLARVIPSASRMTVAGLVAGVGFDVLEGFIPLGAEREDAMMTYTQQRLFGTTDLSPDQAAAMVDRYPPNPAGFLTFIGDSVLHSASEPPNLVWHGIDIAGNAVGDGIWNVSQGIGNVWDSVTGESGG